MQRFFLSISFLLLMVSPSIALANAPSQAHMKATEVLATYKTQVNGTDFGFQSQEAFQHTTVGDALAVYHFDITTLAQGSIPLIDAMTDSDLVEFSVLDADTAITRLTLKKSGDSYSRYRIGGSGESLARGLATLPPEARPLVRLVYLGRAEFLYVNLHGKEFLTSVNQRALPGIDNFRRYTVEEIRPKLQQIAAEILANPGLRGGIGIGDGNPTSTPPTSSVGPVAVAGTLLLLGGYWLLRTRSGGKQA